MRILLASLVIVKEKMDVLMMNSINQLLVQQSKSIVAKSNVVKNTAQNQIIVMRILPANLVIAKEKMDVRMMNSINQLHAQQSKLIVAKSNVVKNTAQNQIIVMRILPANLVIAKKKMDVRMMNSINQLHVQPIKLIVAK